MHNHDTNKYLHCEKCEDSRPRGETPFEYARLSVAVTMEGALLIQCVRHDLVIAYIPNSELAKELGEIGLTDCECDRHEKETAH